MPDVSLWIHSRPEATKLLVGSVLSTLSSQKTKQAYETALTEFLSWTAERGEPLSKPLVEAWRGALLARGLSVSSVNQRLSAARLLFRQAAEQGALTAEEALRLTSVANVKQGGQRLGRWLTEGEAGKLLGVPDPKTRLGVRDRAILALLVACGLRRDERWVLLDIRGKGRRVRTVPVPLWVKRILDRWLAEAEITEGPLFRTLRKGGALAPTVQPMSEDLGVHTGPALGRRHRPSRPHPARSAPHLRQALPQSRRRSRANTVAVGTREYPNDGTLSRNEVGPCPGRQRQGENSRRVTARSARYFALPPVHCLQQCPVPNSLRFP